MLKKVLILGVIVSLMVSSVSAAMTEKESAMMLSQK